MELVNINNHPKFAQKISSSATQPSISTFSNPLNCSNSASNTSTSSDSTKMAHLPLQSLAPSLHNEQLISFPVILKSLKPYESSVKTPNLSLVKSTLTSLIYVLKNSVADSRLQNEYNILLLLRQTVPQIAIFLPKIIGICAMGMRIYEAYLVPEGTLILDILKKCGSPTQAVSRFLFNKIVSVIHVLHENGIAHRAITLDNIYYDAATCNIVICNFEYATRHCKEFTKEQCGKVDYVSPNDAPIIQSKKIHILWG